MFSKYFNCVPRKSRNWFVCHCVCHIFKVLNVLKLAAETCRCVNKNIKAVKGDPLPIVLLLCLRLSWCVYLQNY